MKENIFWIIMLLFAVAICCLGFLFLWRVLIRRSNDDDEPQRTQARPSAKLAAISELENREFERISEEYNQAELDKGMEGEVSGEKFVDTLEQLGFFKYTQPKDLEYVKQDIAQTYTNYGILSMVMDEKEGENELSKRCYFCDGETLFEIGGLEEYLNEVKPIFDQLGIPLEWSDEYWADDASLHTIVLNGKKYDAFRGDPNDRSIWGWATKNFAEMLNDQFRVHGSEERIYLLGGGNDGFFYILTQQQHLYLRRHLGADVVPRTVEDWWENG